MSPNSNIYPTVSYQSATPNEPLLDDNTHRNNLPATARREERSRHEIIFYCIIVSLCLISIILSIIAICQDGESPDCTCTQIVNNTQAKIVTVSTTPNWGFSTTSGNYQIYYSEEITLTEQSNILDIIAVGHANAGTGQINVALFLDSNRLNSYDNTLSFGMGVSDVNDWVPMTIKAVATNVTSELHTVQLRLFSTTPPGASVSLYGVLSTITIYPQ
mmetsp:Transcript_7684/g.10603  ORF Transcript_7684/g.10603 Transcript_7684/m.10603 type:complete len:217 (+) Transcript_7684:78-728(+)